MGLGVTVGQKAVPIADRLPDSVVYPSLEAAVAAGESIIQGDPKAVTPMADLTTGTLPPDIPGGLQMRRSMIVLQATPVPLPDLTPSPAPPPPGGNKLTDGVSNYLTNGAGAYLTT